MVLLSARFLLRNLTLQDTYIYIYNIYMIYIDNDLIKLLLRHSCFKGLNSLAKTVGPVSK